MIELETIAIDEADGSVRTEQRNREHFQQVTTNLKGWVDLTLGFGFGRGATSILSGLTARSTIWPLVGSGSSLGFLLRPLVRCGRLTRTPFFWLGWSGLGWRS